MVSKIARASLMMGLLGTIAGPIRGDQPPKVVPPPAEVRADFFKLLDRPRVPLDPHAQAPRPRGKGLVAEEVDFATGPRPDGAAERVPGLVVKAEGVEGKRPAVIVLHGTGGRRDQNGTWLDDLARRGFVVIAIDGRYHGDRIKGKGTAEYNAAIVRAWRSKPGEPQAYPLYYDTVWDVWRTVDYLQSRPDVDPDRIGILGTSKGGIECWLAASADERIKVAVPTIAMQSFRWSLDHDKWQGRATTVPLAHDAVARAMGHPKVDREVCEALWTKVLPGILDEFDGPSMVRLMSPRPMLILNGELDPNCPIEGAQLAFDSARAAYKDAHADDHLKVMVADGLGHALSPEQHRAALDWLAEWLKPATPPSPSN